MNLKDGVYLGGAVRTAIGAFCGTFAVTLSSSAGPASRGAVRIFTIRTPGSGALANTRLPSAKEEPGATPLILSSVGLYVSMKSTEFTPEPLLKVMGNPMPLGGTLTVCPGPRVKSGTLRTCPLNELTVMLVTKTSPAILSQFPSSKVPWRALNSFVALRSVTV